MSCSYDIFLSYSNKDKTIADDLYSRLKKAGLKCFMAEKDISVTNQWEPEIRNALRSSQNVLILITPRSNDSKWIMIEVGAAWALEKNLIPALMIVQPNELIEPISRFQARLIETPNQIENLVNELAQSGSVKDGIIEGQWIDPADNDTVFFKQLGTRIVGIYDYGTGSRKVGVYLGRILDRVFEYSWKWLDGKYSGYGHMTLSDDGQRLSGEWWYGKKQGQIEHVGYHRISNKMPQWLNEKDFEEFIGFLNGTN